MSKSAPPKIAVLEICGKTADLLNIVSRDATGKVLGERERGYVPDFFPGDHDRDYLMLNIDVETGRILNWPKRLSQKVMREQLGISAK